MREDLAHLQRIDPDPTEVCREPGEELEILDLPDALRQGHPVKCEIVPGGGSSPPRMI